MKNLFLVGKSTEKKNYFANDVVSMRLFDSKSLNFLSKRFPNQDKSTI